MESKMNESNDSKDGREGLETFGCIYATQEMIHYISKK